MFASLGEDISWFFSDRAWNRKDCWKPISLIVIFILMFFAVNYEHRRKAELREKKRQEYIEWRKNNPPTITEKVGEFAGDKAVDFGRGFVRGLFK